MQTKQQHLKDTLNDFYHKPVAKVSIDLFFSVSLVIFLAIFAIQPTLLTMSELVKEIDDKKELDQQLSNKITSLNTAQTSYLAIQGQLYLLDEAIPATPQVVKNIKIVEKLATENNILITGITVADVPDETDHEVTFSKMKREFLLINVAVEGDYVSIRSYVESLMNSRRMFVVSKTSFSVEKDRGEESLSATITVEVPYYK